MCYIQYTQFVAVFGPERADPRKFNQLCIKLARFVSSLS